MNELGENSKGAGTSRDVSDDLFAKVFHASPDSITVSRMSDGVLLDVNEGFERISGYKREEVIGRSSLGFGFWADGPQHRDAFIHKLQTEGSVRDFEGRWLTRSNEIRDCLVAGEMIDYQNEKCVVLVITDITDRVRAQRQLERSEKLYRSIVADQTDFIVRWLPGGIRTYVNDAYCKYFGVTRDECIGTSFFSLIPEEWHEGLKGKIEALTPDQPVAASQHQVICPDGSEGWNEWTDRAIFDVSGRIVEYQSVGRDISEQRQAELALEQSRVFTDNLVRTANVLIVGLDVDGKITLLNPAAEAITGYTRTELEGKNWFETLAPRDRYPQVWEEFERLIEGGLPKKFENPILTKDGEERTISWSNNEILQDGVIAGTLSFGVDITERKRAEEALRLTQTAVDAAREAILWVRHDGRIGYANDEACRATEYTREELLAMTVFDIDPDYPRPAFRTLWDELKKAKSALFERTWTAKSGRRTPMEIRIDQVEFSGQEYVFAFARDVAERKRAVAALRASEARYRTLFESASDAIFLVDGDRFADCNPATLEMYRCTKDQIVGRSPFDELVSPPMQADGSRSKTKASALLKAAAAGTVQRFEWQHRRFDGTLFDAEVALTKLEAGEKPLLLAEVRDVSERKRAEDQLVKLNEQLLAEREALNQKNIALHEILNHMEQDREKYKQEICESVEKLILPTVSKLAQEHGHLRPKEVAVLKNALEAIIQKDIDTFASNMTRLSARELDICELIKAGCTSKEISRRLNIAVQTVHTHRHAIRRKLQLKNKAVNLSAYLRSR